MLSLTVSTRQPPAGGPGGAPRLDELLTELRRGEREGFVRYFQLLRSPVYAFARRLLGDETQAVAATTAAFVAAFRQVILDEDVADLWVVTCRCALEACADRAAAPGAGSSAEHPARREAPRLGRGGSGDASRRFGAALEALPLRRRAALLLHDMGGLNLAQMAAVFAVSEEAAGALLFRAREEFRQAFDERSADGAGTCRQAEQAAAAAVGLGLGDDALRRLHRHAAYCRPCRAAMKTWGAGPVGLTGLLGPLPLPRALATPPVFGGVIEIGDVTPAAGASVLGRGLRSTGRFLRSRAAAYAVAVACLALAGGLVLYEGRAQTFFFAESVGPAIRLLVQPAGAGLPRQHPVASKSAASKSPRPSTAGSQTASAGTVSSSLVQVASETAGSSSSGEGATADSRAHRTAKPTHRGSHRGSAAKASSAADGSAAGASSAADWSAAKAARGTLAWPWQRGNRHDGHKAHRHKAHRHKAYGHRANGHRANGHNANGHRANGHNAYGHRANGHRADGHKRDGTGSRSYGRGAGRHNGHRHPDRHGHGGDHRASRSHGAHGAWSHASGRPSRASHAHGSGTRHGRSHAKKNY